MPRYKIRFILETPLAYHSDVTFEHQGTPVVLNFKQRKDKDNIFIDTVASGANWQSALDEAMDSSVAAVLDALCLHRLSPAMLRELVYIVKAEGGPRRRAIVQHSVAEQYNIQLAAEHIEEVRAFLGSGVALSHAVMRWLRYSYRPINALERFIYTWLAFENISGTRQIHNVCPHCGSEVNYRAATNWERASEILAANEPNSQLEQCANDIKGWNRKLRNPALHGGRATNGGIRGAMADAQRRLRPAIERVLLEQLGYKRSYKSVNPNDGLLQVWHRNFVEFDSLAEIEFAEPPDPKVIADFVETGVLPDSVVPLRIEDSNEW